MTCEWLNSSSVLERRQSRQASQRFVCSHCIVCESTIEQHGLEGKCHPNATPSSSLPRKDDNKKLIDQVDVWGGSAKLTPRIFCGIFTHKKNHATKVKVR